MKKVSEFLFIESYCHGSHALFVNGLAAHSTYDIDVFKMSGQNFRWRMLGAAIYAAFNIPRIESYKGIIVSDLFNLADFKAIAGPKCPPVLVYFHENQLTYPQPPGDKTAVMLGVINVTTAITADMILFNSKFHKEQFIRAVPKFLIRMPDYKLQGVTEKIEQKSKIIYPGIELPGGFRTFRNKYQTPPLIIWNHRWGYDKNPELFFWALEALVEKNIDFQLALLGENSGRIPEVFHAAQKTLNKKILQFGYVSSRDEYINWLRKGSIVVSTSNQENFGMSIIEASMMGCIPLLPEKLSYPEILPEKFHQLCLYKNKYDLVDKLTRIIKNADTDIDTRIEISKSMNQFLWENLIEKYDMTLKNLAENEIG
jgi:glycosyltransferase involved in cell wall biosynthesis